MSKAGALDLASGLGGKIEKKEVLSAVEQYEKYHNLYGGADEERKSNYTDMVNKYYDLATSFYEFGWGESFHFAHRFNGESLRESIKRHEHFLGLQLALKPGQKSEIEIGDGLPDIRSTTQCIEALQKAGFEASHTSSPPKPISILGDSSN
ncbi:unnamed protein product [Linum tenue]|uniref:Uncharacterized protein n=1 Tax=Linum tenue TaxID=586396 RepID=A0AAV0I9H0_9ROSI|nr:unnamed protein product [Linum tenue]